MVGEALNNYTKPANAEALEPFKALSKHNESKRYGTLSGPFQES